MKKLGYFKKVSGKKEINMIAIPIDRVEEVLKDMRDRIDSEVDKTKAKLGKLGKDKRRRFIAEEVTYLNDLHDDFKGIILAKPSDLINYRSKFEQHYKKLAQDKRRWKKFKNKLLKALGYSSLRNNLYPEYFQKLGIKTCVYCNSQLTVAVDHEDKSQREVRARFQVDHYLARSEYPCFSISFYNLYPVCASCNGRKSSKGLSFALYSSYSNDYLNSAFDFRLIDSSIALYAVEQKPEVIKIDFSEPGKTPTQKGPFQEMFDIEGIYDTQKDIAEELILKRLMYAEAHKISLRELFEKVTNDTSVIDRLITGNYGAPEDIHKRPMAKFTQDIARQLGLIE